MRYVHFKLALRMLTVFGVAGALGLGGAGLWAQTPNGFWRFDNATFGVGGTVPSIYNNTQMQGTIGINTYNASWPAGILAPSADVPGVLTKDPITGLEYPNRISAYFEPYPRTRIPPNNTIPNQDEINYQYIQVPSSTLLTPSAFTIEFFMKAPAQWLWPGIVVVRKAPEVPSSHSWYQKDVVYWGVGKADNEFQFLRVDPDGGANSVATRGASTADGKWHHFAFTYSGGTWTFYQDYVQLGTTFSATLDPTPTIQGLFIGANHPGTGWGFFPYWGLVDEIRFTPSVLSPSQFLQAIVPEPATISLACLGGLVVGLWALRRCWLRRGMSR
ncbi:MAG: LamG domain-containing protein [Thermoguttaceae bacterium]|nr:LamG domain-containing protein [Thermoguttaceae bacterium]MDW8037121.1 LamG domain-containing protein [Thermoguttaceae bacterium]